MSDYKTKVVLKFTAEDELMNKINQVYCNLSPENLTCDGELCRSQVIARKKAYEKELKLLFKQLGREVSEEESWNWWDKTYSR
jgi:hypothetical protein